MRRPRLSSRLSAVLSLIPDGAQDIADVGAGHGSLSAALAASGGRRVIAIEAQRGPLTELERNLREWELASPPVVRTGLDLEPIADGEVDTVIVAGLSARTALRVCGEAQRKGVRWMVLQCMQGKDQVEPWLSANGWRVVRRVDAMQRRRSYPIWLVEVPN
ncbi:MAG TPA: tRNA (adenine(22)-N(1))-methyltransferase TrmK [Candidatus Dormibacteraeota bacterium]|nr:tRNA (adenine(22)-N(1))-methyltransferase TrmK [Candidatus Dormibacteraeota bacterium]